MVHNRPIMWCWYQLSMKVYNFKEAQALWLHIAFVCDQSEHGFILSNDHNSEMAYHTILSYQTYFITAHQIQQIKVILSLIRTLHIQIYKNKDHIKIIRKEHEM